MKKLIALLCLICLPQTALANPACVVCTVAIGALTYVYSQKFYEWLKQKNNGHAHFPFEKVVLPLTFLFAISGVITYYPFQ